MKAIMSSLRVVRSCSMQNQVNLLLLLLPRSRCASEQPLCTQILVYIRPMNTVTATCNFPIAPLLRVCLEQSGIPRERHGNNTAVLQSDAYALICKGHICHPFISAQRQNAHSTPPAALPCVQQQ